MIIFGQTFLGQVITNNIKASSFWRILKPQTWNITKKKLFKLLMLAKTQNSELNLDYTELHTPAS